MRNERVVQLARMVAALAVLLSVAFVAAACTQDKTQSAQQSAPATSIKYTSVDEDAFWIETQHVEEALSSITFNPPVLPDAILAEKPRVYIHDGPANSRGLKYKYDSFEILIEPVDASIDYASIAARSQGIMRATVVGGFPGLEQNRGVQKTTTGQENAYPSALQWQDGPVQYTLRSENSDLPAIRAVAAKLVRARQ